MRANGQLINTTKAEALLITPFVRKTSLPFVLMFDGQTIIPTEESPLMINFHSKNTLPYLKTKLLDLLALSQNYVIIFHQLASLSNAILLCIQIYSMLYLCEPQSIQLILPN